MRKRWPCQTRIMGISDTEIRKSRDSGKTTVSLSRRRNTMWLQRSEARREWPTKLEQQAETRFVGRQRPWTGTNIPPVPLPEPFDCHKENDLVWNTHASGHVFSASFIMTQFTDYKIKYKFLGWAFKVLHDLAPTNACVFPDHTFKSNSVSLLCPQ